MLNRPLHKMINRSLYKDAGAGFLVGVANIIPGVSGGTLLFILGLYERTLGAIGNFNAGDIRALVRHAVGVFTRESKTHRAKFIETANALDLPFLIKLVGGALFAIIAMSSLMEYLLENQLANAYAFFFGLIVASAVLSLKMLKTKRAVLLIHFAFGAAVTVAMSVADDPVANAKTRSDRYEARFIEAQNAAQNISASENAQRDHMQDDAQNIFTSENAQDNRTLHAPQESILKYFGRYSTRDFVVATVSGAIAICAMILPGLSGSLVLILLGQYHEVISAISNLRTLQLDYFVFLSIMSVGMLVGILLFARLVKYVFKRWHDGTVACLVGLMVGSLYALWPFKKTYIIPEMFVKASSNVSDGGEIFGGVEIVRDAVVHSNINILPSGVLPIVLAVLLCAVGAALVVFIEKRGAGKT